MSAIIKALKISEGQARASLDLEVARGMLDRIVVERCDECGSVFRIDLAATAKTALCQTCEENRAIIRYYAYTASADLIGIIEKAAAPEKKFEAADEAAVVSVLEAGFDAIVDGLGRVEEKAGRVADATEQFAQDPTARVSAWLALAGVVISLAVGGYTVVHDKAKDDAEAAAKAKPAAAAICQCSKYQPKASAPTRNKTTPQKAHNRA